MSDVLEYKKILSTVQFSAEDDVFYGKLVGINDLVTFEGQSVPELKAAFIEAVDDYVASCKELGKQPEKTYKGSFNVRVTTDLHRRAALMAAHKKITLNEFMKVAIAYALSHEKDLDNVQVSS